MDLEEIKSRMLDGRLYFCNDASLCSEQLGMLDLVYEYNHLRPSAQNEKKALLKQMFAEIGDDCYIETPFYANWGGRHVHFGKGVYANFGLTLVDDGEIFVGDNVLFAPHVTLASGTHPIHPELRRKQAQYNLPIRIGNNVWIGACSVILPGVKIGDNSVIGAGSVVTKDIPADVVAAGNPCKILRPIAEKDRKYYAKNRVIEDLDMV